MSAKADIVKALGGGDICAECKSPSAVVTRRDHLDRTITMICHDCRLAQEAREKKFEADLAEARAREKITNATRFW